MRWKNKEVFRLPRGNNYKTLRLIDKIARSEQHHPFIERSIERMKLTNSKESAERIFNAIYKLIPFYPDPKETQYVRTVNRQLKDRRGNCVDYTTILTAFLRKLKIPHKIRMVSTEPGQPGYNHIYVVLGDGTPMDLVINQDQTGKEASKKERRSPLFGSQVPFIKKFDRKIL